jgi:hypothetical protein
MPKQASMPKQKQMYERERSPSPEPIYNKFKPTSKYNPTSKYKQQNYEVPSKESYYFDHCHQPMDEICEETNYFQYLPDDIKIPMLQFICEYSREGPSVYGEYDAPPDRKTVESINGKGGYFLKKTAESADIYLIWYNRQKNIYKFWGPTERAVRDAMNRIRGRIVKYVIHAEPSYAEPSYAEPSYAEPSYAEPQQPKKYNGSNHDIASSPPPCQYSKPVFDEKSDSWTVNFAVSAEYNPQPLDSMAVDDYSRYSEEDPAPIGICRSMSYM